MRQFFQTALLAVILSLTFIFPTQAQDQPPVEPSHVKIRLLAESPTVKPGEAFYIAIEQTIDDDWHTYWKNPGDSGVPPLVKWAMPEGFSAGEIEFPVPHKIAIGPLTNYGYNNSAILLQKIMAPNTIPDGPFTLSAKIDILVCKDICIPESGTYELTLNNGSTEDNKAYFEAARRAMPMISSSPATYFEKDGFLNIEKLIDWSQGIKHYVYIPAEWGVVENAAEAQITENNGNVIIKQKRSDRSLKDIKSISGLLLWSMSDDAPVNAYEFTAIPKEPIAELMPDAMPAAAPAETTFAAAFIFALLGGLVLNLMPCVFPVLSIKALSLVKISEKSRALARLHGIAYTLGIILSFLAIAGILLALKAGGAKIGWGFQLQNPEIVAGLAYLLFIIGLNLSGVFEVGNSFGNVGNKLTTGNTPLHSFFTGVLATLVATPCTAPFMATALGFALLKPAFVSIAIFAALGFGLAFPYLLLSIVPALQKILPRPGVWMDTFKQLLAFPMYASAAWLVWVLSQQAGTMAVLTALMGMVLIAFGIWLLRHSPTKKFWRFVVRILAIISILMAFLTVPSGMHSDMSGRNTGAEDMSEAYSPEKLKQYLDGNEPVFVEMTAAWCITCKVNHAIAINIDSTRKVLADNHVHYLVGDWTSQDPLITEYLSGFGRNGVPLYVFYGPRGSTGQRPEPVVLPQILTPGIVQGAIIGK